MSGQEDTSFDAFFRGVSLAPGRECGACVACCERLEIHELNKPAMQLCAHCTGAGCGIYQMRPSICRDWFCVWRRVSALPDWARPDRLGVMFELATPEAPQNILMKRFIRGFSLGGVENFDTPETTHVLNIFRQAPMPVWLNHAGRTICVHPGPEVQDVLLAGAPPLTPDVAREAEVYRTIYDPL
jgi:hypothetical protein